MTRIAYLIESFTHYEDKNSIGMTISSGEIIYRSSDGVSIKTRGVEVWVPNTNIAGIVTIPDNVPDNHVGEENG